MNIILLGPPASGKDIQVRLLAKKLKLPELLIGKLMRREAEVGTKLGWQAQSYMKRGINVPPEIIFRILKKELDKAKEGFILNNYPRSLEQLEVFKKYLQEENKKIDKVFHLKVSLKTCLERMRKRVVAREKKRADETEKILKIRYKIGYQKELGPILQFFKKQGVLVQINGEGSPREVFQEILSYFSS